MVVIQRVRVRWSAAGRGAPQANARRGLNRPVILPAPLPTGDVVVHDVLADEAAGYARRSDVMTGGVRIERSLSLSLAFEGSAVTVERLPGKRRCTRLLVRVPEMVMSEQDVVSVIESDPGAMRVLRATAGLGLPDWWIGAGFVRNRVWDAISGLPVSPERDVDVAYFDPEKLDPREDARAEAQAMAALPEVPWEIRNQARMHLRNGDEPYTSTLDAISRWPETATCVAVTLRDDAVRLVSCHGLTDLVGMVVRPSPAMNNAAGRATVQRRVEVKGWLHRWAGLRLEI